MIVSIFSEYLTTHRPAASSRTARLESDGTIDFNKLIHGFQDFFRKHSETWRNGSQYREAVVQLLLQAFLQHIVNNGGYIFRGYGLGKKRTDLLVICHKGKQQQEVVIELKIRRSTTQSKRPFTNSLPRHGSIWINGVPVKVIW